MMAFPAILLTVALITTTLALQQSHLPRVPPPAPCSNITSRLHLQDGPHDNYFYSDCRTSVHVIVTSPQVGSDSNTVKPRLLVAWPAGNSGAMALFAAENSQDGALGLGLENSGVQPLKPLNGSAYVGISGSINFNVSARLTVPILGSIRSIRDELEGGGVDQDFQNSFGFAINGDGSASINRTWLDNVTTTTLKFTPVNGARPITLNREAKWTLTFGAGTYQFEASYNYPQLKQLNPQEVLNKASSDLIAEYPDQTTSLSFLSYNSKLLAGSWRFLTYFGRDSLITMLLMQPILSDSAIEAVLGAALERVNHEDGSVCHEEIIGDYATWLNWRDGDNENSTAERCDYKMIDTDFFLPIALKKYFVDTPMGRQRKASFLDTTATLFPQNIGITLAHQARITAEKIMRIAAPFAKNPVKENLLRLHDGESVGQWRDSGNGLGGGRIPYDVNTALVPAGLRAIGALSREEFFWGDTPEWNELADEYAQIWEDETLQFFEITVPQAQAKTLVKDYISNAGLSIPTHADNVTADVKYYGLALDGPNMPVVPVMNTDDCYRLFFLNTTNEAQLSAFLSQTADHILQPFPVGLSSDVGLFVANPAYSGDTGFAAGFSNGDYHGTVVWSWQLAMMGAGLARQLDRCEIEDSAPDFCYDEALHGKIMSAYNRLWDVIDANRDQLSHEVWSWKYEDGFRVEQLGLLTNTESNIRQLWSLIFLAVRG